MNEKELGQITMLGVIIAAICLLLVVYFAPMLSSLQTTSLTGNSFVDAMSKMILPVMLILLPIIFFVLSAMR